MLKTYYDYSKGKVYGILTCQGETKGKGRDRTFLCKCVCGQERWVRGYDLVHKRIFACVKCSKERGRISRSHVLPIGKQYGKLSVVMELDSNEKNKRRQYLCMCECGNTRKVYAGRLIRGQITQCRSCSLKQRPQSTRKCTSWERIYNLTIAGRCKKNKRIKNQLNINEWKDIVQKSCHYCNAAPEKKNWIGNIDKISVNGVDRIDSTKNYSIDNCVPCCKTCNIMKGAKTVGEFIKHVRSILDHNDLQRIKEKSFEEIDSDSGEVDEV